MNPYDTFDFDYFVLFIKEAGYIVLNISLVWTILFLVFKSALSISKTAYNWYERNLSNKDYPK